MEFRIEKRARAVLTGLILLAPAAFAQETLRYEVWHGHSRPPHVKKAGNRGTLTVADAGVSFEEIYKDGKPPKHPHSWQWRYDDIQQLTVSPKALKVLTYKDNKWKLGADREYEFDLTSDRTFEDAYSFLRTRLDQRLVAAIPRAPVSVLWEIPVKHLTRFGGDEGVLQIGETEIVYKSVNNNDSRTWRYEDIENVSSAGLFQLSITTFERAKSQYGSLRDFNFQLKQKLSAARYNDLWLRLNRTKGLTILDSYREGSGAQSR
jgi:hypothetical protein